MESAVLQWVRLNDVAWAHTVKNVLGERLRKHAPEVFTDCEGIGAPLEAFRILEFIGALGPYHHLASCEIDQDARAWLLKHHRCPDVVFGDMLARTWPGGVDVDLLTNTPREIPHGADIYICGFPCCPFSLRKSNSKLFEEEKAWSKNVNSLVHVDVKTQMEDCAFTYIYMYIYEFVCVFWRSYTAELKNHCVPPG